MGCYYAAKITKNTIKLMQKYRKKSFGNDLSVAIKSCF